MYLPGIFCFGDTQIFIDLFTVAYDWFIFFTVSTGANKSEELKIFIHHDVSTCIVKKYKLIRHRMS